MTPSTTDYAAPVEPPRRFEQATDEWRQVVDSLEAIDFVTRVQRRFIVQDGPVWHAMEKAPPDDADLWVAVPGHPMCWCGIKSEWRTLPTVNESELRLALHRDRAAAARASQQTSTTE